jgi:hypothetical protein
MDDGPSTEVVARMRRFAEHYARKNRRSLASRRRSFSPPESFRFQLMYLEERQLLLDVAGSRSTVRRPVA